MHYVHLKSKFAPIIINVFKIKKKNIFFFAEYTRCACGGKGRHPKVPNWGKFVYS